ALWSGPVFEQKSLAILLLGRYEKILDDDSWRLADRWVDAATGWGLSDGLASGPIAGMLYAKPSRFRDTLRWTRAKNIWRRRASTYALHRFVRAGELDRPFQLLEKLLYDEEFWVQRAVGTWLRECWKQDPRRRAPRALCERPQARHHEGDGPESCDPGGEGDGPRRWGSEPRPGRGEKSDGLGHPQGEGHLGRRGRGPQFESLRHRGLLRPH